MLFLPYGTEIWHFHQFKQMLNCFVIIVLDLFQNVHFVHSCTQINWLSIKIKISEKSFYFTWKQHLCHLYIISFLIKKCERSEVELDSNLNFELAIIHHPSQAWLLILKRIIEGIHQSLVFEILQNATIFCLQFSSRLIIRSSSMWSSFLKRDLNYIYIYIYFKNIY